MTGCAFRLAAALALSLQLFAGSPASAEVKAFRHMSLDLPRGYEAREFQEGSSVEIRSTKVPSDYAVISLGRLPAGKTLEDYAHGFAAMHGSPDVVGGDDGYIVGFNDEAGLEAFGVFAGLGGDRFVLYLVHGSDENLAEVVTSAEITGFRD